MIGIQSNIYKFIKRCTVCMSSMLEINIYTVSICIKQLQLTFLVSVGFSRVDGNSLYWAYTHPTGDDGNSH